MPGANASIGDLVRTSGPTFSFEFFPPKTPEGERQLWQAIRELEPLRPSFVSITYGAGGSTRDTTVAVTERIATETTLLPMAHLTAVNHSVAELRHVIGDYAGGRHPQHPGRARRPARRPAGRVGGATPRAWATPTSWSGWSASSGDFCVGVAAFPEKHPRSPDFDSRRPTTSSSKCRAGADFAITQMFFGGED